MEREEEHKKGCRHIPSAIASDIWDEEWDEFPPDGYCLECGAPLKSGVEEDLCTCDLCGREIYGADWGQYKRQAAMCVRRCRGQLSGE